MSSEKEPVGLVLEPGEKGVVGAMTVENRGEGPAELAVYGDGPVLHEQLIIKAEDANTPALKIYHQVLGYYLDPDSFMDSYKTFVEMAKELVSNVPSTGMIMSEIGESLMAGDFRDALTHSFELMQYEALLEEQAAEAQAKATDNDTDE